MRIVIALADDALHRKTAQADAEAQRCIVRSAALQLARVADGNELVIVHADDRRAPPAIFPDHDGADHDGAAQMACLSEARDVATGMTTSDRLALELRNLLPSGRACATLHTTIEVDIADPAFAHPDKRIGAVLLGERALAVARAEHWRIAQDGIGYRRVVPNPSPLRLLQSEPLRRLMEQGTVVMCAVGGVPVAVGDGRLRRVEALVDKYAGAALVAEAIDADLYVIATDRAGVFLDWGTANSKLLRHGHPSALSELVCATGCMAPKLQAASRFAQRTGRRAAIGALNDVARLVEGTVGTTISCERADPRRFDGGAVAY
jgi:carbamate kinase